MTTSGHTWRETASVLITVSVVELALCFPAPTLLSHRVPPHVGVETVIEVIVDEGGIGPGSVLISVG